MAFGGLFGGSGSSDKNNNSSSSSSPSSSSGDVPSAPIFSTQQPGAASAPLTSNSSSDIKARLQSAVQMQSNVANAKALISKINENCFDHCVTSPGSSLSSKEQSCLSSCMEKYIDGWNVVSRTYVGRLQKEGAAMAGITGGAGGAF